jgi:hypothetical protein
MNSINPVPINQAKRSEPGKCISLLINIVFVTDAEWGKLLLIIYGGENLDFEYKHLIF